MITIETIKKCPQYIENVIKLGDENSKTLGFLPQQVFYQAAHKNRIIVAHSDVNLAGYLLYRISNNKVSITHFCVASKFHGQKISDKLFNKLIELTKPYCKGIKLNCRRDYTYANKLWERLDFIPVNEKKGRDKKKKNILTVWWYDFRKRNLFTLSDSFIEDNLIGVLDVNVFSDIEKKDEKFETSLALNSDWLVNDIQFCLVDEIYNELNREKNQLTRKKTKNFISNFTILPHDRGTFKEVFKKLEKFIPNTPSQNTISDFKQVGKAIAGNANFFITRDKKLLKQAKNIEEEFNLKIVSPATLILEMDENLSSYKYEPRRLAGTSIKKLAVNSTILKDVLSELHARNLGEKKKMLEAKIDKLVPNITNIEIEAIVSNHSYLGLIGAVWLNKKLEIPFIRIQNSTISRTFAKQIITEIIQKAIDENLFLIEIDAEYLPNSIVIALEEARFININDKWIKILLSGIISYTELKAVFHKIGNVLPEVHKYTNSILEKLKLNKPTQEQLYELERALFPVKIKELDIPNYSIPIHPAWAKHLFDEGLANQELFGAKEKLVFNRENIYYCSAKNKSRLTSPARILWYVTNDNKLKGTKAIRAISYLENFEIDFPKTLFKKYKNLGIYEWKDIFKLAKEDIKQEILALRFTK